MDDDTKIHASCSATLNGEFYVLGSRYSSHLQNQVKNNFSNLSRFKTLNGNRQFKIAKVIDCRLKRIGDLNYIFPEGTCGTFLFPEERILFCFGSLHKQKCDR